MGWRVVNPPPFQQVLKNVDPLKDLENDVLRKTAMAPPESAAYT
jgi:hypothetical protein